MSEVQDRETTVTATLTPPQPATRSADVDPFLSLHKMSTTAGLGSADYVAINGSAIAAVVLGIASAFVLMGSNLLLILPLAGIICATLAFVQVGNSNGTQTGRGLAGLGLLLSIGLGSFYVVRELYEVRRNQADTDAVVSLIHTMGQQVSQLRYDQAYAAADEHMREHVTPEQFAAAWQRFNTSKTLGGITRFDWNHLLEFGDDPVTGDRVASGTILIAFQKVTGQDRESAAFRKLNGSWQLEDLPSLFAAPDATAGGPKKPTRSEPAGPPPPGAGQ